MHLCLRILVQSSFAAVNNNRLEYHSFLSYLTIKLTIPTAFKGMSSYIPFKDASVPVLRIKKNILLFSLRERNNVVLFSFKQLNTLTNNKDLCKIRLILMLRSKVHLLSPKLV